MRWGTDATMAWTRADGWVWVFACVDHYTAEAWAHVAKVGDRFAALQPVYDAVIDRWGRLDADVARGLALRHDWGPQYRSAHFLGSIGLAGHQPTTPRSWVSRRPTAAPSAGSAPSRSSACGPSCTTPSTSCARPSAGFVDRYNTSWLIQRHGHQTPKEAYQAAQASSSGMIKLARHLSKKPGAVHSRDNWLMNSTVGWQNHALAGRGR